MSGQPTPCSKLEAAFQLLAEAFKEKAEQERDGSLHRWTVEETYEGLRRSL